MFWDFFFNFRLVFWATFRSEFPERVRNHPFLEVNSRSSIWGVFGGCFRVVFVVVVILLVTVFGLRWCTLFLPFFSPLSQSLSLSLWKWFFLFLFLSVLISVLFSLSMSFPCFGHLTSPNPSFFGLPVGFYFFLGGVGFGRFSVRWGPKGLGGTKKGHLPQFKVFGFFCKQQPFFKLLLLFLFYYFLFSFFLSSFFFINPSSTNLHVSFFFLRLTFFFLSFPFFFFLSKRSPQTSPFCNTSCIYFCFGFFGLLVACFFESTSVLSKLRVATQRVFKPTPVLKSVKFL